MKKIILTVMGLALSLTMTACSLFSSGESANTSGSTESTPAESAGTESSPEVTASTDSTNSEAVTTTASEAVTTDSGDNTGSEDSKVKLSDTFTHEDPADIEFEKRYILYSAQSPEILGLYKDSYGVELLEEFFILYGDKDDVPVRSYNYYICATEEDAANLMNQMKEYGGNATVEGSVVISIADKDELKETIDYFIALGVMDEGTASAYAQANKEQFESLFDYVG